MQYTHPTRVAALVAVSMVMCCGALCNAVLSGGRAPPCSTHAHAHARSVDPLARCEPHPTLLGAMPYTADARRMQSAQRTDAVRESQTPTLAAGTFGNFRIAGDHPHTLGSFGTQLLSVVAPALHTPHRAASVSAGSGSACSGLATSSGQCTSRDTPAAARLAPVLTRPFETHGRVSIYLSQVHASKE